MKKPSSNEENAPLLLKIDEAARLLSMGRSKAYQMAASGELPGVVRFGHSVRVSSKILRDWVAQIESQQGTAA